MAISTDRSVRPSEEATGDDGSTILAHPLLVVAVLAAVLGALSLWWTATHRGPGGLDVDETAYLTQAFRWHRMLDPAHPFAVFRSVLLQDKAPITPLFSAVALTFGPNSVTTAFAAPVFFHGLAAVAVAGISKRLAGPRVGILAGCVVLTLPVALVAARSYQFAAAVAAALSCAVWALLASSRGRRTWPMVGFGVSVGVLLLTRTMAVAFVPGLALACVLHVDRTRVVLRNAGISAFCALAVAGPWWWAQRVSISEYLLGHGYGDAAEGYGPTGLEERISGRWSNVQDAVRTPYLVVAVVLVAPALLGILVTRRHRSLPELLRSPVTVVWVVVASGALALVSTANMGLFFEMPLIVLGVAGVAGLVPAAMSAPTGRAVPRAAGAAVVVIGVLTLGASLVDSGGRDTGSAGERLRGLVFAGLAPYQWTTIEAEPRLGSNDRNEREDAMREWSSTSREVVRRADAIAAGAVVVQTVCGSGPQVNANTFTLAGELDHLLRDSYTEWLSTSAAPEEMESRMRPFEHGMRRIVVLIDSESDPFPGEQTSARCAAVADRLGWEVESQVPLPGGGRVDLLVHPENR